MRANHLYQSPKRERGVITRGGCAMLFVLALAMPTEPVFAQQEADFQQLLADKAPAIVTVKFVLKVKSDWRDSEAEHEVTGAMIEPDGLVLCSNSMLSGFRPWSRGSGESATPTDIKVLVGDDTEGLDAQLVARDSELDLTWIRIDDSGDAKFAFIDLKPSAVPKVGERLYVVARLSKFLDRAPVVRESRVGGITSKPRPLYVPSRGTGTLGLPIFNAEGLAVGVAITQRPDSDEAGGGRSWQGASGVILPAAEVLKATQRAKEAAADEEEED